MPRPVDAAGVSASHRPAVDPARPFARG